MSWLILIIVATPEHVHGFRLFRDEAERLELNESALLTDDNFAVLLTVHHNLHCLVNICLQTHTLATYILTSDSGGSVRHSSGITTIPAGKKMD